MKQLMNLLLAILSFSCAHMLEAHELKITEGTMTAGGRIAVPYKYDRVGRQQISLREEAEFGYFVVNSLQLNFSLQAEALFRWSRIYPLTTGIFKWGGKIGAEYIVPTKYNIYPFAGLKFGARINNFLWDKTHFLLEFPIGLQWAMNEHLALSFAVPIELAFSKANGFESVEIIPGYFGVVGYF